MELLAPYGSYARRHQSEDTIGLLRDRMVARTRSNFEVVCISRVGLIDLHRSARLNSPRDFQARCSIRKIEEIYAVNRDRERDVGWRPFRWRDHHRHRKRRQIERCRYRLTGWDGDC